VAVAGAVQEVPRARFTRAAARDAQKNDLGTRLSGNSIRPGRNTAMPEIEIVPRLVVVIF
jgi:hypothetical protein